MVNILLHLWLNFITFVVKILLHLWLIFITFVVITFVVNCFITFVVKILLHLWLTFYYICGWILLHLW